MRYIAMREPGDASVLMLDNMDAPQPASDEVLIDVAFAGVNRPDVVQRQGFYPPPPGASPILGLEVSGTVRAVGAGVSGFAVGDRVCALTNGGGYAQQVCTPVSQCLPVPEGLGLDQAAALPETFFTVWTNVFDRAGLKPGETLLIHGGASGIGTTAIQLATALGSRVIVTASSEDKCAACLALGASAAINYSQDDFVEKVAELTDGQGANVILDMVGGDYIERNIKAAAIEGRIVNIAFLRGAEAKLNFMPIMLKRLTLTGSTLRPQSKEQKAAIASSLQEKVWPLISDGTIRPKMAAEFPMADAESAHRLMESHDLIGKIVLNIQGQEQES